MDRILKATRLDQETGVGVDTKMMQSVGVYRGLEEEVWIMAGGKVAYTASVYDPCCALGIELSRQHISRFG